MIRNKGKINTVDGVLFCFLASVIIAVFALNIGLVTEPGKILPTGLSMRSGETDTKIIRGIEIALDDTGQRTFSVFFLRDGGIVLVGVAILAVAQKSVLFQQTHHRGECVEMGARLCVVLQQLAHKHGSVLPIQFHDFFFFVGQLFHCWVIKMS